MDSHPVPVADLGEGDARRARTRGARVTRRAIGVLVVTLVAVAVVAAAHVTHDPGRSRRRVEPKPDDRVATVDDGERTLVDVEAALAQTVAADTYDITYRTSETPAPSSASEGCGGAMTGKDAPYYGASCADILPRSGLTITGHGTVSVRPLGILTVAGVGAYGEITTRYDGNNVWETGGGNYGTTGDGTGAPLSKFADLVISTLGRREGAVAMGSLATPTGYIAIEHDSITGATDIGKSTVDGDVVTVYSVDVDWLRATNVDRTPEQAIAAANARAVLATEGYQGTTVRLSVDGNGFVRRTQSTAHFTDGGTVDSDTRFSNFGCSTLVPGPHGPDFLPDPSHCG